MVETQLDAEIDCAVFGDHHLVLCQGELMPKLGVNIDHVATLRQARREDDPDPVLAAIVCEQSGADSLVVHLREDRRHIQDHDLMVLRNIVKTRLNLEMSLNTGIVDIACNIKPDMATIVPERREEVTTEGGLDVLQHKGRIAEVCNLLKRNGIQVSLFIAPEREAIQTSADLGVDAIELHTGAYAAACIRRERSQDFQQLASMCAFAQSLGLSVNAGHGLNYDNVRPIARIEGIAELNIGHAIIARAVFVGLSAAVKEMRLLL